ncbi:derlin-1 [Bombus affinis]|uniref:Derlin n=1 Tax=Bombus terrestris TaxID=30195 RepID=A0A9B0C004_BOMTE|nr:derlin-1 [Bombus terrestris]XP_050597626.1 derlin-1 [Bombus affinis]
MSDVRNWINSLPIFTRYWLLCTIVCTLVGRFGLINPTSLILINERFINNFEIWRAATSVFFYPLNRGSGFHFLINCYFLYNYSLRLERGEYDGRPADYCFLLLFNWICCVIIGVIGELHILMDPMVLSILYVWCQLNKDAIVNFWFGTQFKAVYLPWVLFAFNLIISGGGMMELFGILVGHLYVFLKFKYPQELGGPELLNTPKILESYFPSQRGNIRWFGAAPTQRTQTQQARNTFGGHNWGRGYVLGD